MKLHPTQIRDKKTMKRKILNLGLLLTMSLATIVFYSCDTLSIDEEEPTLIQVQNEDDLTQTLNADATEGVDIHITTTGAWTSIIPQSTPWITISPDRGNSAGDYTISIEVENNLTDITRIAVVTILSGKEKIEITVYQKGIGESETSVKGNMGNYQFGYQENGIDLNYQQAVWELKGENLTTAKTAGAKLELKLSTIPDADMQLAWQGPDNQIWWQQADIFYGNGDMVNGVTWNAATRTLTIDLEKTIANYATFKNQSSLNLIICYYGTENINDLGIVSANLIKATENPKEPEGVSFELGGFNWENSKEPGSQKGWELTPEIRAKIADGTIKYLVLAFNAATIEDYGFLPGMEIITNSSATNWTEHPTAFSWNWNNDAGPGFIGYDELFAKNNVEIKSGIIYLSYDIRLHPSYEAIKTGMVSADAWLQLIVQCYETIDDLPLVNAYLRETK